MALDPTKPHATQALLQEAFDFAAGALKTTGSSGGGSSASGTTGTGAATDAQLVVIENELRDALLFENWNNTPGNIKEISYFSAVDPTRNPSGNNNVDTILFKQGGTTELTQTFTYDANDNVTKIETA